MVDFAGTVGLLVAKSDPITFATDEIGFYAVNVCANDLATGGDASVLSFCPRCLCLRGDGHDLATTIFAQIGVLACRRLDVVVAGGHSEITHADAAGRRRYHVGRRCAAASSTAAARQWEMSCCWRAPCRWRAPASSHARSGMNCWRWVDAADVDHAAELLHDPGISVLTPALAVRPKPGLVSAMHDPTEGGVITGLHELATAAGVGLAIDLRPSTCCRWRRNCAPRSAWNPLGVIASGALLATCAPDDAAALQELWSSHGWTSCAIGTVTPVEAGLRASRAARAARFHFVVDEITKLFA
ncbi:MAG: AIR synthase-related protein [Caldilineaceae bacterium]